MTICKTVLVLSSVFWLGACGSDGDSTVTAPELPLGKFSLAISDSPMAGVSHVGMVMGELVMTDASGVIHRHDLQNMAFNLLDFQGIDSHLMVDSIDLPSGQYHDAYVTIHQGDGNQGCYVEDGQGRHGLHVENGQLPISDVEIVTGQHLAITMEIDLYRGLSQEQGQYNLSHEAMWSIDNSHMGHLLGEVDPQWIADCETAYADLTPAGGQFNHLAYLYPEQVTNINQMADMGTNPPASFTAPTAVSPMMQDIDGNWHFSMGYLPAGNYRVGYSCLGHLDDPIADDISSGSFVMFKDSGSITIETGTQGGQQTVHECGNGNGGHHGGMHGGMGG
ncbi:hypothetical protein CXF83_11550 [Shewanella sp. Choline-02u-19]|uniref:DUF4382 domain-containing protein n=1 Tax=unclassified Shewanella TaxID=196818 RepID=UPI000C31F4E5|nr:MULTISPECIES: DUF4382 domain-containing protein [unclassified Shewanella]PKG57358.1 hypothetical protein CXF82_10040 [Shewanella sp. GutDb-MelDb]PKH56159.1 hypothetical protein CXF84_14915 [Shewanella sp. Bg11-22]PKI27314.1 hypothetical protein CXF83_11550 [Shewanella sp. Choline-02u-19]